MTTVEQIRAEIDAFKELTVSVLDGFAAQGYTTAAAVNELLTEVGIERPEAPEVRQAREDLAGLKSRVQAAIASREANQFRRYTVLRELGL